MDVDFTPVIESMSKNLKNFTDASNKTLEALEYSQKENGARLLAIEQKIVARGQGGGSFGGDGDGSDIGQTIVNSDGFKRLQAGEQSTGMIKVGSLSTKTTVVSGTWSSAPERIPGIVTTPQRRLMVRDLLPIVQTSSQSVEFAKETAVTNAAGYQVAQGDAKPESAITYSLVNLPVQTLAHWLPASRQLLDDSTAFASYVNGRLMYLLALFEESELLFGTGATGHLNGIYTQASVMSTANANTATDNFADTVGEAIGQLADIDVEADGIVMNQRDWLTLRRTKTTGTALNGSYIFGDPLSDMAPRLWGLPVVATNSMTRGQFLVGGFRANCALYDRQAAAVEISREHSDYFVRNLSAILVEQREALVVYRPTAFLQCGFPFGS